MAKTPEEIAAEAEAKAAADLAGEKKMVEIPLELLTKLQEDMAAFEVRDQDREAKMEALQQALEKDDSETIGVPKLREKKTYEPKFRTVRLRKFPIAGDFENMGIVSGWTNRGAYQQVDRTGVTPVIVDYIDIFFLGQERNAEGKLQAEKVKLLDLLNNGIQIHCKIIDLKKHEEKVPTGEEIDVTMFDPQHGLMSTGDKIDGYVGMTTLTYTLQVPGIVEPVVIDGAFVN